MHKKSGTYVLPVTMVVFLALGTLVPTATSATPNDGCNADGGHAHINIGDGVASEADGTVTFTITCNPCGAVNANSWWKTFDGTATAPDDYTAIPGMLITLGTNSSDTQTYDIVVTLNDDTMFEGDETFTVGLGGQPGGEANPSVGAPCLILDDTTATGTIENDDPENSPPTANAGGPYSVPEGGSVGLSGAGSTDPDSDPLTYAWDLDNDGMYDDAVGVSPSFSAAGRNGPDSQTIGLQVSDGIATDTDTGTVNITNVAPNIDAIVASASSINEGGSVTISGTFSDPATASETHTGTATWSDGVATALTVGEGTFSTTRNFADDHPTSGTPSDDFTVSVTINDGDGGSDSATSPTVTVNNVAPTIGPINLSSSSINEGDPAVTVSGTFTDPALGVGTETFSGTAMWSDGVATALTVGVGTFSTTRSFADDHPLTGTASDNFTVTISLSDDDGGSDSAASGVLTVNNVAPTVATIDLDSTSIDEGDPAVTVSGTFTDPALGVGTETFTGSAMWSDGVSTTLTVGSGTFSTSRTFDDDHPATGTASDIFTVDITITDDDLGSHTDTSPDLTVNNLAPVVDAPVISPEPSDEGSAVVATATFDDAAFGVSTESFTCTVNYGDGEGAAAGTVSGDTCTGASHTYADNGIYDVTVTVTDDDTGAGSETSAHQVDNVDPTITATTNSAEECGATAEGVLVEVSADFSDPGFDKAVAGTMEDFDTSTIDWGDLTVDLATVVETPGGVGVPTTGTVSGSHVYASGGIFTITITVEDDDGGTDSTTLTALVTGAGLTPAGLLGVVGTDFLDVVNIQTKGSDIEVQSGILGPGKASFPTMDVVSMRVVTCDDNDQIHVNHDVSVPAILEGGPGADHIRAGSGLTELLGGPDNDHLFAGDSGNVLEGEGGDDDLNGGMGNDLLFGGEGDDKLAGAAGDDVLDGGPGVDDCNPGQGGDTEVNCEM